MSAAPDYKVLYEKALQETQQAQTLNAQLQHKLSLALLEIDRLRRELFGTSSDNRVTTLTATTQSTPTGTTPMDAVELTAPAATLESIEEQTKQEVAQAAVKADQTQGETTKSAAKKREKILRMQLPQDLPREEVVIDPKGDLTDYIKMDLPIRSCILGPEKR